MNTLRNIHIGAKGYVALIMILFAWAITLGPNASPPSGTLLFAQDVLHISPLAFAAASLTGAVFILMTKPKEYMFLLAALPIIAYHAVVIVYALNNGFNLGANTLTALSYFYILKAAKD